MLITGPLSLYLYLTLGQDFHNKSSSSPKETSTGSSVECGKENEYTFGTRYTLDDMKEAKFEEAAWSIFTKRPSNNLNVSSNRTRRIVLGEKVSSTASFPWIADLSLVQKKDEKDHPDQVHHCGAAIISEYFILTAANCLWTQIKERKDLPILKISVGEYDQSIRDSPEEDFSAEAIIIHEDFMLNGKTYQDNIALIKLKPKDGHGIRFDKHVQPVCLPSPDTPLINYSLVTAAGWGESHTIHDVQSAYSRYLYVAEMQLLSHSLCQKIPSYQREFIDSRQLCAGYEKGGIDICGSDNGGPLVQNINGRYILLGIASVAAATCGLPENPSIFANVQHYLPWIFSNMRKLESS